MEEKKLNKIINKTTLNPQTKKQVGDFSSEKKSQKSMQKSQKNEKKLKKQELNRVLADDKLSKNIISVRKQILKTANTKTKNNEKRLKKCNKKLLNKYDDVREIYLTIDKFNNNEKKTIVYFIDSFFPVIDGVVSVLDNYAKIMSKYYNVVVCAPKHKSKVYNGCNYFVLQSDSIFLKNQGYDLGFPQLDAEFQKYISLLKIDLVHIHAPFNMGSFGLNLAKKRKVPSLITFHSQFKQNFYNAVKSDTIANWLTKFIMTTFNKTTQVITMNDFAKGVLKEYGLKKSVEIIPNATNLKEKEFSKEYENEIVSKHGIDKNKFNILFIGRFVEVKNVYFILSVISELYKKNKDFNFIFLGYGPEQSKMQKICKQNGIENIVKFTGKIDSVDEKSVIIKNSDLLFFPSVYDTDGIVKIEAACYGVPTLCIENTGVSANMINDRNGFIEKYDEQAFVDRLDFLIKNVDFVKKVGETAKIEIYITWEEVGERLRNLYEKFLNTHNFKNRKKNKNKSTKKW